MASDGTAQGNTSGKICAVPPPLSLLLSFSPGLDKPSNLFPFFCFFSFPSSPLFLPSLPLPSLLLTYPCTPLLATSCTATANTASTAGQLSATDHLHHHPQSIQRKLTGNRHTDTYVPYSKILFSRSLILSPISLIANIIRE